MMHKFVQRAGFWGILACASIPNPLFDLAGLTCGHFLVRGGGTPLYTLHSPVRWLQIPFRTFFGATLIGKAVVKVHIQVIFLVLVMSQPVFERILATLKSVPVLGEGKGRFGRRMRSKS